MHWPAWWIVLSVLVARGLAQSITPTMCEEEACRCDAFTRVICNCTGNDDTVTLRPYGAFRVPPMATAIIIDGCARVQFLPDTVRDLLSLRNVEIRSVSNVVLSERALSWSPFSTDLENHPGIRITIHNSTVNEILSYAVQGRVDSIVISDSRLMNIKPFAFSSLKRVTSVEMINNKFDDLNPQIFKTFRTSVFLFRGNVVKLLPSRFLSNVEVTSLFRFEGTRVDLINSLTFIVSSPERVIIENNVIGSLLGDAFHIDTRGPVTFRNNTINEMERGALLGLSVQPEVTSVKGAQELLVDNNTIRNISPSSLQHHNSLALRVDGLNLNASCSCHLADEWREILREQGGNINCWYVLEGYFISIPTFVDSRCGKFKQTFWIFVVVGVIVILIVASIVLYYILKREKEKKKKLQIVMPDGKTYKETEFHIIVERAELLTTDL